MKKRFVDDKIFFPQDNFNDYINNYIKEIKYIKCLDYILIVRIK